MSSPVGSSLGPAVWMHRALVHAMWFVMHRYDQNLAKAQLVFKTLVAHLDRVVRRQLIDDLS